MSHQYPEAECTWGLEKKNTQNEQKQGTDDTNQFTYMASIFFFFKWTKISKGCMATASPCVIRYMAF